MTTEATLTIRLREIIGGRRHEADHPKVSYSMYCHSKYDALRHITLGSHG